MRKLFWIILTLLFLAFLAPGARADSYTIDFTLLGGNLAPTSGAFDYDPATNQFTNFTVVWDGFTFDLTSSANTVTLTGGSPSCVSAFSGPQAVLAMLTTCAASQPIIWSAGDFLGYESFDMNDVGNGIQEADVSDGFLNSQSDGLSGYGGAVASPIATPEPSSMALLCAGVALAFALRKLIA
jgi:PEP-CTERM motif